MEHKVTLVVGKNGSIEVLNEDDVELWAELMTLGVLLILSTALNFTAIGCSLLCKSRGTLEIPPLIFALLASNAFDTVVNQTVALVFLSLWPSSSPPTALCQLSGMTYLAAVLLQPLYVLMNFLHILYVRKRTSLVLIRFFHTLPPVVACALSTPIILLPNAIPVHQIINRHACGIAADNLVYSTIVVIFGFFSSWAAIAFCVAIKRCLCEPAQRCCDDKDLSYALIAIAMAAILVLPAVASFGAVSMTSPKHLTTFKDSEDSLVVITGAYDTALTWAKFSFDVFSPLSVLLFYKEIRCQCFHVLASLKTLFVGIRPRTSSRSSKETRGQGGPILFVTPNGLMLMTSSGNGRSPVIDACDLLEEDQTLPNALTLSDPRPPSLSPAPEETPKKPEKPGKRKIVRFAQSVVEIPA